MKVNYNMSTKSKEIRLKYIWRYFSGKMNGIESVITELITGTLNPMLPTLVSDKVNYYSKYHHVVPVRVSILAT